MPKPSNKSPANKNDQPQSRQARLQERLKELNAYGEKEMAAIMETIERAKAAFKSKNKAESDKKD